jgi:tetratricopeptide (TPR) repeat protein
MACCPPLPEKHPRIVLADPRELVRDEDIVPPGCAAFSGFEHSIVFSTGCGRGYIGTWEIKDGRFFLVGIRGIYELLGEEPIFADWFTGVLRIPRGEVLNYVHGDFLSVYEAEVRVSIDRGVVVKTRVVDNRPPSGPAASHYEQGRTWRLKREHTKSIAAFSKAVQLHPDYADAYYARALSYEFMGDYDRSLADLQKVLLLQPGAIQVGIEQQSSFQEGFLLQPWEYAREDINRDIARVRCCRGMAFLQKGEWEMAVADCTESIELDPQPGVPLARLARGKAYCALRRFKEAIEDLNAFAVTNPEDERVRFDIYYRLANCYREIRSYTQAIFNAGIAIRLDPNNADAYFLRGIAYLKNDEYNKAVRDLTEAIQLRPRWADAYVERAKAYRALADEPRAAEDVTKAEQLRS